MSTATTDIDTYRHTLSLHDSLPISILATLMALIPLIIIVPTYLWLDRYEAEPVRYLVAAFLWGALIAVVGSFFLNSLGLALLVRSEEHTSELQSLMRTSYAVFCLKQKN